MAEPVLSSSDPVDKSTGVYLNKSIRLVFQDALDSSTVNENTIHLMDLSTQTRVSVSITYDSSTFTITVLPTHILKENTLYRIIIVGNDLKVTQSLSGTGSSDDLTTSIILEFTTGDDLFEVDTTIEKEAQSKTLEGDLFLPSNVKALGLDFVVEKVRPKNYSSDNSPSLTGDRTIRFTFSKTVSGTPDISDEVDIDIFPLFDQEYLASGQLLKTEDTDNTVDWAYPTGTVSVTGSDIVVTFGKDLPKNAGVEVHLSDKIISTDNDGFGGMTYRIATELFPRGPDPRTVKRELRHIGGDMVRDDYIAALSLKNLIILWEQTGRSLSLTEENWARTKYTLYATILDIIEDQEYEKFLVAGNRHQVGDLNLSVDQLIGRVAMKAIRVREERDRALETIKKGWQFAISTTPGDERIYNDRLWYGPNGRYINPINRYSQPDAPIGNTSLSRQARTNNPMF